MHSDALFRGFHHRKVLLRGELLRKIKAFHHKEEESLYITKRLLGHPLIKSASTILAYNPLSTEPDISPLLSLANVATPFVEGYRMDFTLSRTFHRGGLGFLEAEHLSLQYDEAVIIVPMLGFDSTLHRLGRGGGYYDRYLSENKARLHSIGVAFSISFIDEPFTEPHDETLDEVIIGKH